MSLLHTFCQETKVDYSQFIPALFRGIIHLMNDSDELVVDMSWNALNAVTKVTSSLPVSIQRCLGFESRQNTIWFWLFPLPNYTEEKVLRG